MVVFSTTNDLDVSVDHIVTTWGYADAAMVDLQNDTGLCRAALLPGYTVLVAEPGSLVATWGDGTVAGDGHHRVVDHARGLGAVVDAVEPVVDERLLDIAVSRAARSKEVS